MLLNSDAIYREYELDFLIPIQYYDKSLGSGNIMVSGIIDLLFKKDDAFIIVDYKTDNVYNLLKLKDMYEKQLELYEIAIKQKLNAKRVRKFIYSIKLNKYIEV